MTTWARRRCRNREGVWEDESADEGGAVGNGGCTPFREARVDEGGQGSETGESGKHTESPREYTLSRLIGM